MYEFFWNLLLAAGYVTLAEEINPNVIKIKIPNKEVKEAFKTFIREAVLKVTLQNILEVLFDKDTSKEKKLSRFEEKLKRVIMNNASVYDMRESFYHGIIFGLAVSLGRYEVSSNIEYRKGRPDLVLEDKINSDVLVIELKKAEREEDIEKRTKEGMKQIKEKGGVIRLLSIGFCGKELSVLYDELG